MDFAAVTSAILVLFQFFPRIFHIFCLDGAIPGEYVLDNKTNLTYYLMTPNFIKIADDLPGAEGPIFDNAGNFYVATVSELAGNSSEEKQKYQEGVAGKLYKVDLKTGEKTVVCAPWSENFGGMPVGCAADREGSIWIADLRLGLLKYTPGGGCELLSTVDTEGNPLQGLDDLIFDEEGNLWITGPSTPVAPAPLNLTKAFTEHIGALYYLAKGGTNLFRIPDETFGFNNGIVVKKNLLLQAESQTDNILAFDITGPGQVQNKRVWAKLPKAESDQPQLVVAPDGMDFDAAGNLLVAHHGASFIEVFSPEAKLVARIKCPFQQPTNLQFAPSSCTCYVTDHDTNAVYKFEWICKGWPTYAQSTDQWQKL